MIDAVTANENLVINAGEGSVPSPPPSSPEVSAKELKAKTTPSGTSGVERGAEDAKIELTPEARDSISESDQPKQTDSEVQKELNDTINRLNDKLNRLDREIQLKIDERIGKNYVSVIDKSSKEIIREFPPEEIRSFIARFMEFNDKLASETDLRSLIINLEV